MNRKIKQTLAYILLPVAFVGIGIGIYQVGFKSLKEAVLAKAELAIIKGGPSYDNAYNEELLALEKEVTGMENNGEDVGQGEVEIPAIGTWYGKVICDEIMLDVPLYYGDSEEILKKGVGQYTGSGFPGSGKTILIGGHDATFFEPLEKIEKDYIIKIVTNSGTFSYKVAETKVVNQDDSMAYDLEKEEEQLILYTCYPFGMSVGETNKRFFVYGEKVED